MGEWYVEEPEKNCYCPYQRLSKIVLYLWYPCSFCFSLLLSRKLLLSLIPISLVIVEKRHNFNYPRPVEVSSGPSKVSLGLSGTQFSYTSHLTISAWKSGGVILPKLPGRRHIFIFPGGDGTSGISSHVPCLNSFGRRFQITGLIK